MLLTVFLLIAFCCVVDAQFKTNCAPGRHVIVHLFEWRWDDIAEECERFLGPKGFCGVQISPPNEHRIIPEINPHQSFDRYREKTRPWYERYQPVSYKLTSRSGTEAELKDMIRRCNNVNVRIYADAVINHMTGAGASGIGSAGSGWNSGTLNFGGVPYSHFDFNRDCNIENYLDATEVRNCRLVALVDLNITKDYVRGKIADYMNNLISSGVAGFRVDASKHMHPVDLEAIYNKLTTLNTTYFPTHSKPLIFQEVIDLGGEGISANDYLNIGRVTEFKYGRGLARLFRGEVQLKDFPRELVGLINSGKAVSFVDNHDNQRGHGGGGNILTFRDPRLYKMANAFMMASSYGFTRVMSSYNWPVKYDSHHKDQNDWIGPPASNNTVRNTKQVPINPDGTCGDDWMCEHRWRQITNMVAFRNSVEGETESNSWNNGANQIAFGRGHKGFLAINKDDFCMNVELNTGMLSGTYCDVISGNFNGANCSGRVIRVTDEGKALIDIPHWVEDPIIAIHSGSRVSSSYRDGLTGQLPDYRRTVVLVERQTSPGEDMFIRGGIDHIRRPSCRDTPEDCKIPISYRSIGDSDHYQKYNDWRVGDETLDWGGVESGQGTHNETAAQGSPLVWTTSDRNSDGYQEVNSYGEHYWLLDVNMDCSKTENGWFEAKTVVATTSDMTWENDLTYEYTSATLPGTARAKLPFCSRNHFAMCGKINVMKFGSTDLTINDF